MLVLVQVHLLFVRADPSFERVIVIHPEGEDAKEWDDCNPDAILDYIPSPTSWGDGDEKTLCVVDDICFQNLNKQERGYFDRLLVRYPLASAE